jgi:hypothetical protein
VPHFERASQASASEGEVQALPSLGPKRRALPPRAASGPTSSSRTRCCRSFLCSKWLFPNSGKLRTAYRRHESDSVSILQVSVDGRDYHAGLDRNQVNTDEGNAHPCVDHNTFVQYAIKYIN